MAPIVNSGRPRITGTPCMGVWKPVRESTFRLNHVALSQDASNLRCIFTAGVKEHVTLNGPANGYRGTFTIDQFDTSGNVLAHIAGVEHRRSNCGELKHRTCKRQRSRDEPDAYLTFRPFRDLGS